MSRNKMILKSIADCLANNNCKHAQVMNVIESYQGKMYLAIKVTCLDTDALKEKVTNLLETLYCESLMKIRETKTTVVYVTGESDEK